MATGQQGFDPDDFVRRDREQDERRREQERIDSMRRSQERLERDEARIRQMETEIKPSWAPISKCGCVRRCRAPTEP